MSYVFLSYICSFNSGDNKSNKLISHPIWLSSVISTRCFEMVTMLMPVSVENRHFPRETLVKIRRATMESILKYPSMTPSLPLLRHQQLMRRIVRCSVLKVKSAVLAWFWDLVLFVRQIQYMHPFGYGNLNGTRHAHHLSQNLRFH